MSPLFTNSSHKLSAGGCNLLQSFPAYTRACIVRTPARALYVFLKIGVVEHGNRRVRYSDGARVRTIGSLGAGTAQLQCPCGGMAIDSDGRIAVADSHNNNAQVLKRAAPSSTHLSLCPCNHSKFSIHKNRLQHDSLVRTLPSPRFTS